MPELPTGTITFLFTDIEGSTRLWEEQPDAMRIALERHDALLRQAIETNSGHIFKTMGDAFYAAFPTAPQALEAALGAQHSLQQVAGVVSGSGSLQVRMALHTGSAEVRQGDYFGQPLNRVARLLSAGHGGQVLLSLACAELVRDSLPSGASLQDLGSQRLRDLSRPEQVYQLLHPLLPCEFPPLRSLEALPNNLPQQLTSFVGREKEIRELKELLSKTRLLTLTGSGGAGKTRLMLQLGADLLEQFSDGVWLVELASLADPALVPQAVASALGLKEEPGKTIRDTLQQSLKGKELVLLLDNCEHLLHSCAELADRLLSSCPGVKILASSREGLNIPGEQTYRVPSLAVPDPKHSLPVETLSQYEAVKLFIERACFHQPSFTVTNGNAPSVAEVCCRLDGIPLAIELAAARVRAMSVEQIASRLDDRFRLLTGGSRTALPRQQTLRALADWSYNLLTGPEKILLNRLSVFMGGWDLAAAEAICSGGEVEEWEVLDLLTGLVDKSLVVYGERAGIARYGLLETIRQYACEKLASEGEGELCRRQHRDYFLALAEEAGSKLSGMEQARWLGVLEIEHDNLRHAMVFCLDQPTEGEAGLRLGTALQGFWETRGHLSEGRDRLRALLSLTVPTHGKVRARALNAAGNLALRQGDFGAARSSYEESTSIFRELGDRPGMASTSGNLGSVAFYQGNYASADSLYRECLAIRREMGDEAGAALALANLGAVAYERGDYASARCLYEESLAADRETGNKRGIAMTLNNLGVLADHQGDYDSARSLHQESLTLRRELGDKRGVALALNSLGDVVFEQGDRKLARSLHHESLVLRRDIGDKVGIAYSIEAIAALCNVQENTGRAAELWGAAERLREEIGLPLRPNEKERYQRDVSAARRSLGNDPFLAAWAQGRSLSLEQAMEYALQIASDTTAEGWR